MKSLSFIGALVLALAVTAFVVAGEDKGGRGADTTSLMGKKAPDFSMKTLDGQNVALSDLKGNVVLLDFWATWCPPCREALPHVQSLAANTELAGKGLKVFAVNLKEKEDKVKPFMAENNYSFTVPMDDGKVAKQYMVQGIPTQVLIGRDGMIKKVFVGWGGEAQGKELDGAIEAALKAKVPSARGPATNPAAG